ncbi:MAG: tRNA pseudouridine(55) synthase TruB [Pseudomonadales bacterium]|nr:tRNA pseudouridine(55) synthase TruB [Pseudomonadales bacterium]
MSRRRRNNGRKVNGILVLDKPIGITSNAALQRVKRLFGAAKAGHTGSLDPLASGVLPICFGEATKFSQFLLDADKGYQVTIKLGVRTDSSDAEGEIVSIRPSSHVTEEKILEQLKTFEGETNQVPSMFSAIKHNGQPLYKLARQGIEVERTPRRIFIEHIDLIDFTGREVKLDIACSKGTYIRTIADDLGELLGCGAHVIELRRNKAGPYELEDSMSFEELNAVISEGGHSALDNQLLPLSSCVVDFPELKLTESSAYYLRQGQAVQIANTPTEGWVQIHQQDGEFIGVGEILDDGRVAPRRLVVS